MTTDIKKGRYTNPGKSEGSRVWEYLTIFVCSIMSMSVGNITGWNSPSIVKLMAPDSPILITASEASTLVAIMSVGYTLASPPGMFIVNKIGRKYANIFSALPLIISWALVMIATNIWVLYVARFMAGLSFGLFSCVFAMYMGEIALPSSRGAGVALNLIMFNLGILGAFIIVPYLSISASAGVYLAVTLGFVIGFWFMPDSPYYLAMKGRMDEAEETLEKLRGRTDVSEEMQIIVESVRSDNEQRTDGIRELLTMRGNRRAFLILNLFMFIQHFGGFFMVISYAELIFQSAITAISAYTATVVIGVMQLLSTIVMTFVVDRLGRRPLVLFSGVISAIANLVIGVFFYARDYLDIDVSAYSLAPFISAMLLVFACNCGQLNLSQVVMSEIFAIEIKALAICLVGIIAGCIAVTAAKAYILVSITWGYGHSPPFLTFTITTVICTAVIHHLLPETKGKSFVQIQKELND